MESRNNQKGSAAQITLVIVLVVALLGALGYIFWQKVSTSKDTAQNTVETNKSEPTTVEEAAVNASFTTDELSFEYPKTGWNAVYGQVDAVAEITSEDYTPSVAVGPETGSVLFINHTSGGTKVPEAFGVKNVKETTIDGNKAYTYDVEYEVYSQQAIFTANNTDYLVIMQTAKAPTDSDREVFNLVLSTLAIK